MPPVVRAAKPVTTLKTEPGIVAHGVALKPGKPVIVLPGARAIAGTQFADSAEAAVSLALESVHK